MREEQHMHAPSEHSAPSHKGHSLMMMVCCIPMLGIGALLVVTGVVKPAFLLYAVGCTAMMALMMRGMNHGGNHEPGRHYSAPPAPPASSRKSSQGDR